MDQRYAEDAIDGLAFGTWLRVGIVPDELAQLRRRQDPLSIERKFNPYHDPKSGQFTSGAGAGAAYRGITAQGIGTIRPVGGGGVDRNGRHVPELFAPDPYALRSPVGALLHYVRGSGGDRNYYFNKVDTSRVKLSDFEKINKLLAEGKVGLHLVNDAVANYNGGRQGKWRNVSAASTVGGLRLLASGVLAIARDGNYRFSGRLRASDDKYDFNPRDGRSTLGDASTTFGRQLSGRPFAVHLIGSKPFSARGRR